MLPKAPMLVLRMHPSLRQTQGTVTVVQGPCDGSWLLGSTALGHGAPCWVSWRLRGQEVARHCVPRALLPCCGCLLGVVCGASAVGWSRRPDGKHGQTSWPFSGSLGSQA